MKRPLASLVVIVLVLRSVALLGAERPHDFARWEKEVSAYEQMDRTNPPPKGGIVFIGSSTIRLWKSLPQDFPGKPVINRGFGGSELMDSTHFADRLVFPYVPKMVFLRAGGNDIHAGKSATDVFSDFQEFVKKIKARLPETEIVFISWSPSIARWDEAGEEKTLNGLVEQFSRSTPGVRYIETYELPLGPDGKPRPELFMADKLHFNSAGYKLLAERVRPVVNGD